MTPLEREGYERARRAFASGEQMRELRAARGLTQDQLAKRMGTTQSVVARLEARRESSHPGYSGASGGRARCGAGGAFARLVMDTSTELLPKFNLAP